jgi:hypothetical protein
MTGFYRGSSWISASRIFWFCRDFADTPSAIIAGNVAQNMHIHNLLALFDPINCTDQQIARELSQTTPIDIHHIQTACADKSQFGAIRGQ